MIPLIATVILLANSPSQAQTPTFLALDAVTLGNQPTAPGTIDPCVEVAVGSSFDVDLQIRDVTRLWSWQVYLVYDRTALEVTGRNVQLFQAANPGSSVIDASEPLPDQPDRGFLLSASETAHAYDTGSGVLARITMQAKASGLASVLLPQIDVNVDGTPDLGPTMQNNLGEWIGDLNGDGYFDGAAYGISIAAGVPCPASTPVPSPSPLPTVPPTPTAGPTTAPTPVPSKPPSVTAGPPASKTPQASDSAATATSTLRITDGPTPTRRTGPSSVPGNDEGPGGDAPQKSGPEGGGSSGLSLLLMAVIGLATITGGATLAGGFALYNRSRSRDTL